MTKILSSCICVCVSKSMCMFQKIVVHDQNIIKLFLCVCVCVGFFKNKKWGSQDIFLQSLTLYLVKIKCRRSAFRNFGIRNWLSAQRLLQFKYLPDQRVLRLWRLWSSCSRNTLGSFWFPQKPNCNHWWHLQPWILQTEKPQDTHIKSMHIHFRDQSGGTADWSGAKSRFLKWLSDK